MNKDQQNSTENRQHFKQIATNWISSINKPSHQTPKIKVKTNHKQFATKTNQSEAISEVRELKTLQNFKYQTSQIHQPILQQNLKISRYKPYNPKKANVFKKRINRRKKLQTAMQIYNFELNQIKRLYKHLQSLKACINNDFKYCKTVQKLINSQSFALIKNMLFLNSNITADQFNFEKSLNVYSSPQIRDYVKYNNIKLQREIDLFIVAIKKIMFQRQKITLEQLFTSIEDEKDYLSRHRMGHVKLASARMGLVGDDIEQMENRLGQFEQISPFTKRIQGYLNKRINY